METDEDDDGSDASGDERVTYQSTGPSLAGTLRERLFGKGKGRADAADRIRPITTAPGVVGAGETETEGEDPVSAQHDVTPCVLCLLRVCGVECIADLPSRGGAMIFVIAVAIAVLPLVSHEYSTFEFGHGRFPGVQL